MLSMLSNSLHAVEINGLAPLLQGRKSLQGLRSSHSSGGSYRRVPPRTVL